MKIAKRIFFGVLIWGLTIVTVFLIGRYGWKAGGFRACESAGIEAVTVKEGQVQIKGFYPGSFPEGFLGYYSKEENENLYVGYKFSAVFGIFEKGDFDITIPTGGEINKVYTKTSMNEELIWSADGERFNDEEYGVFVRLEPNAAFSVKIIYDHPFDLAENAYNSFPESGEFYLIDNNIAQTAKEKNGSVEFMLRVETEDGKIFAQDTFTYDEVCSQIFLSITEDGRIVECNRDGSYKQEDKR